MRTKEFDEEKISEAAMKVFWKLGYADTSIEEIVQSTGLGRGSLYNAYGNKHSLYKNALEYYYKITASNIELLSKEGHTKDLIHQLLIKIIKEELEDSDNLGCMVANASLEMARHDKDIANLVSKNLKRLENAILKLIVKGQKKSEINSYLNPSSLASFYVNTIQGMRVVSKGTPHKEVEARLIGIVETAISIL